MTLKTFFIYQETNFVVIRNGESLIATNKYYIKKYPEKKKTFHFGGILNYSPKLRNLGWLKSKEILYQESKINDLLSMKNGSLSNSRQLLGRGQPSFFNMNTSNIPDEPQIIQKYNLILQNFHNKKFYTFGERENQIQALEYHEPSKSLLAGGEDQRVILYKFHEATNHFETLRDFGDLGILRIISSSQVDELFFFGGSNGRVRVIDVDTQNVLGEAFETAVERAESLEVCRGFDAKCFLAVGGLGLPESSDEVSDFLDVSLLVENYDSKLNRLIFEKLETGNPKVFFDYNRKIIKAQDRNSESQNPTSTKPPRKPTQEKTDSRLKKSDSEKTRPQERKTRDQSKFFTREK